MADRVGQQLGNYRLIRLLGEGAFADVYLGEHIHLNNFAAIKVLHTRLTSDELEQFRNEARTIAHLVHPHIIRVLEFGIDGRTPFLVMDYAPNGSLRQRHPKSLLPLTTIVSYVKQISEALQYAHNAGIVHRDIKPENMLLGRSNEVLLSDFGIAIISKSVDSTSSKNVAGTAPYMAPEQIKAHPSSASDQYALGIVVYEWLSGNRPFQGTSFQEICAKHLFAAPPPLQAKVTDLLPDIEQVVLMALNKDPYKRFMSVRAFANALEQASRAPVGTTLYTYHGHSQQVNAVAWSPNSIQIASGSLDGTVQVWDTTTGHNIFTWQSNAGWASSVAWSPDGKRIASGFRDGAVRVWSATTGDTISIYHNHPTSVNAIAWSPDSTHVASASHDGTVQVWSAATGNNVFIYRSHSDPVNTVAWSPDGKHIASASHDGTVQVWNATTGKNTFVYRSHSDWVEAVAWSFDGKRIASASQDKTVQVWGAVNGQNVFIYHGHSRGVNSLAWSSSGMYIASGSHDRTVQVWGVATGDCVYTYRGHTGSVSSVAWSPDSKSIASGSMDKTVQVWVAP